MGRESLQGNQHVTIFSGSQKFHPKYFECTELVFVRQLVNTKCGCQICMDRAYEVTKIRFGIRS